MGQAPTCSRRSKQGARLQPAAGDPRRAPSAGAVRSTHLQQARVELAVPHQQEVAAGDEDHKLGRGQLLVPIRVGWGRGGDFGGALACLTAQLFLHSHTCPPNHARARDGGQWFSQFWSCVLGSVFGVLWVCGVPGSAAWKGRRPTLLHQDNADGGQGAATIGACMRLCIPYLP